MIDNGDFNALVNSYVKAAAVMGDGRDHVEMVVSLATRQLGCCPSCRHSRAPLNVVEIAEQEQRLEIYRRSCSQGHLPGLIGCPFWEALKIPMEMEVM
jgi:hypothetical protein